MANRNCNTESIYKLHGQGLLAFINSRVKNEDESMDVLQDTFVQFEECCQKGCECNYPKSYLFKIALNAIADFFKSKKKEEIAAQDLLSLQSAISEEYSELPCDVYSCTYEFLADLSLENQVAFIKSDIENIPQKQIAKELNIPISTLKSRVQRTRRYLKKNFENCFNQS